MSLNLNKMWLPALVSDGMVLQRGNKTSITGKASKNEDILIEFCDKSTKVLLMKMDILK